MFKYLVLLTLLVSAIVIHDAHAEVLRGDNRTLVLQTPKLFTYRYAAEWNRLKYAIDVTNKPLIIVYVAGRGGSIDLGESFTDAVDRAKARGIKVKFVVIGYSASMHALILCHASSVQLGAPILFHIGADGHTPDYSNSAQRELERLMSGCVSLGIVTRSDIRAVQSEHELIVFPNGRKIIERDRRLR